MKLVNMITMNGGKDEDYDHGERWRISGIRLQYPTRILYVLTGASLLHSLLYYLYLDSPLHVIPLQAIVAYPCSVCWLCVLVRVCLRYAHHCHTHIPFPDNEDLAYKHFAVFYAQQQYVYIFLWWAVVTAFACIAVISVVFEAMRQHQLETMWVHASVYSIFGIYITTIIGLIYHSLHWRGIVSSGQILEYIPLVGHSHADDLDDEDFSVLQPITPLTGITSTNTSNDVNNDDEYAALRASWSRNSSVASSVFSDDDLYDDEADFHSANDTASSQDDDDKFNSANDKSGSDEDFEY